MRTNTKYDLSITKTFADILQNFLLLMQGLVYQNRINLMSDIFRELNVPSLCPKYQAKKQA